MKCLVKARVLAPLWIIVAVAFTGCFTSSLKLFNETSTVLIPFPVVTDPPPPHREENAAAEVPINGTTTLDPNGFNPLFFAPGVSNPQAPNALLLQFDLYDADPSQILWRVMHYPGIPGQEGNDPALQPKLLREELVNVPDVDHEIQVIETVGDVPGVPAWQVNVVPIP